MRFGSNIGFSRYHAGPRKGNGNLSNRSGIFPIEVDFLPKGDNRKVETATEPCIDNQILKDKGGKKFLLLLVKKGIIIGLYPKEGGCHGYILRPQDHAGAAPFHF